MPFQERLGPLVGMKKRREREERGFTEEKTLPGEYFKSMME